MWSVQSSVSGEAIKMTDFVRDFEVEMVEKLAFKNAPLRKAKTTASLEGGGVRLYF